MHGLGGGMEQKPQNGLKAGLLRNRSLTPSQRPDIHPAPVSGASDAPGPAHALLV